MREKREREEREIEKEKKKDRERRREGRIDVWSLFTQKDTKVVKKGEREGREDGLVSKSAGQGRERKSERKRE